MSRKWNVFNYSKTMNLTLTQTLDPYPKNLDLSPKSLTLNTHQDNMYPMVKFSLFSSNFWSYSYIWLPGWKWKPPSLGTMAFPLLSLQQDVGA